MEIILDSLISEWRSLLQVLPRVAIAILILITSAFLGQFIGRTVERIVLRSDLPNTHGSFFRKLIRGVVLFFGVLLALNIIGLGSLAAGLLTGGGVTAIVLGFAFREIGENFLAGFFLAFSRPFKVGDLIESSGLQGVVRSIELRYTHIRTPDGRDIFIPSSQIFKNPLVNFTRDGLRRFNFSVGIDYSDDPLRAAKLITGAVSKVDGVLGDPATLVAISGLNDSWVTLDISFWIDVLNSTPVNVRTTVIAVTRRTLLDNGFTVSSNTVSNLSLRAASSFAVNIEHATGM